MTIVDTFAHLPADNDRKEHLEHSPLNDPVPLATQRSTRPPSCACPCYCKEPPLPSIKEASEKPSCSDRSALGGRPPRLNRVTNRVVSLPELAEVEEEEDAYCYHPRVVSMPECVPPMFIEEADQYGLQDWASLETRGSGGQHSTPPSQAYLSPRTPSPTVLLSRGLAAIALDDSSPRGELDPQDWITWASSPPKPIPALHGPLSLPYARCPSGAEGTVIESDDRVSNVIWGLDFSGSQIRPPSDKNIAAERDTDSESLEAAFENDVDPGNALLVAATVRLSNRSKPSTLDGEGVAGRVVSRTQGNSQFSALGLHLNLKPAVNCSGTRVARYEGAKPTYSVPTLTAKSTGKASSRGLAPMNKQIKLHPSASSQLPTPPLSTPPSWSTHLSGNPPSHDFSPGLTPDLATSQGVSPSLGLREQLSILTPPLERCANVQEWINHPNSNYAATQYLEGLCLRSDGVAMSGSGLIFPDKQPINQGYRASDNRHVPSSSPAVAGSYLEPAGLNSNSKRYTTSFKNDQRRRMSDQDPLKGAVPASGRSILLHRRLPVLEEDVSFSYSSSPSNRPRLQDPLQGSAQVEPSRKVDTGRRSSPGMTPNSQHLNATGVKVGAGQVKSAINVSQPRWKQKKEA